MESKTIATKKRSTEDKFTVRNRRDVFSLAFALDEIQDIKYEVPD
jgi:hypothetical protein